MNGTFEVDTAVLVEVLHAVGADDVGGFVKSVIADIEHVITSLTVCDGTDALDALARQAHHLSGGCRALGLVSIGAVGAQIENDARGKLSDRFPEYSLRLAQQRQALADWWSTAPSDPRLSGFWPPA